MELATRQTDRRRWKQEVFQNLLVSDHFGYLCGSETPDIGDMASSLSRLSPAFSIYKRQRLVRDTVLRIEDGPP